MLDTISKLKFNRGVDISFILFSIIVAPYWYYVHFKPSLIADDSVFKILLSTLAVGVPINLLYYMNWIDILPINVRGESDSVQREFTFRQARITSFFTALTFYVPCIATWVSKPTFRESISLMMGVAIFFALVMMVKIFEKPLPQSPTKPPIEETKDII